LFLPQKHLRRTSHRSSSGHLVHKCCVCWHCSQVKQALLLTSHF
jgi:hypothetical protein